MEKIKAEYTDVFIWDGWKELGGTEFSVMYCVGRESYNYRCTQM